MQNPANVIFERLARTGRASIALIVALAALPLVLLTSASSVSAGPPPVFTMYVPFEDQQFSDGLESIFGAGGSFDDTVSTIDITSAANDSVVYWDHWEDGYEADIANPVQSTTQVWGDNNPANGTTPGGPAADDVDAGTVIFLQNTVPLPRQVTDIRFDGRDKVASTRGFAMTRAGWSVWRGTVHAGAVAATDLSKWGTQFDFPVGENTGFEAFDYTGLGVMASVDDTFVQIDTNGDGGYDQTATLDEGETVYIDGGINAGGSAQTSKPAQAHLITGERDSRYEGRWFELFPLEIRGDEYVAAAGSTSATQRVTVFLNNPGDSTITVAVDAEGSANDQNISIAPGAVASYDLPNNSGARFSSPGNPFIAVSGTVAVTGTTQNYDWGYSLVPTSSLTPGVVVGWGEGNPSGDGNHNRIWVAPLDNITTTNIQIYADFDGDGTADLIDTDEDGTAESAFVLADAFESISIVDTSDNDATGARIFTQDGTLISVAWGQDPADGECCDAYDLGTPVLPSTALVTTKSHRLVGDLNLDGNVNPGDTIEYTVRSVDAGALALTNINIIDTLPTTVGYVPNSTSITYIPEPVVPLSGPVADDTIGSTIFPVDESGLDVGLLQAGAAVEVTFQVTLVNPFPLFVQNVRNDVSATSDQGNSTATSIVPVVIPDLYIAKSGPSAPVMPGQSFDYTLDVSNVSLAPQTGIDVSDTLPPEVSWNSTSVTRPIDDPGPGGTLVSTDTFFPTAYDNNSADWVTDWIETDAANGGATGGNVRIIADDGSDRLRLNTGNSEIRRTFDATNWDRAMIDFDWRRENFEAGDSISFQISTTGGTSWIELDTFTGPATDVGYSNITYDLTRYVGQNVDIRFVASSGMDNSDDFFVDNVRLDLGQRILETVPGNAPAALYTGGQLLTGENLTITVNVTADAAMDPTIDDFTNTASAVSAQNASPVESSWTVDVARASIGDTVWHDQNGDGIVDASEPRLAGVEVSLFDDVGGLITSVLTDANGEYLFDDLDPADYTVTITDNVPAGMAATDDADGGQDGTTDVTVTFGENNTTTDFGYATPVSLGDRVYADLDGDAIENGLDFGLDTVTVTIVGTSPNASHQGGSTTVTSTGDYLFTGLLPGTYEVTVDTTPLSTSAYATTAGTNNGDTQTHVLVSGTDVDTADFGYVIPASIGDLVWHDLDASGTFDVGEPFFSGVTVTAQRTDAPAPAITRTTDANGYYLFANLDAGDYDITVSTGTGNLPAGYITSTGGATTSVTVAADQAIDTVDFGFYTPATIGDLVFDDLNGDGDRDPGEPGLEGLTVTLFDGTNTFTTTTGTGASAGEYDFTGVEPGTYTVSVDTSGFPVGTVTSLDGSGPITVESADDYDDADFGYVFPATFGDFVFHDLNDNGTFDTGEPGIPGVTMTLTSPSLAAPLVTATSGGGAYLFSNLAPGTYTVTLDASSLPTGYTLSTGGNTDSTLIVSGSSYLDADFGANTTADIGDFIFHDLNANGTFDVGEPALGGVEVTLTGTNSSGPITPQNDTTDGTGSYLFADLDPGSYTVTVNTATVPAGYAVTAGNDTRSTTLVSDTNDLTLDFGYATTASVGDFVWNDLNGDGIQNDGAASIVGIENVDVTITGTSAGASHTTGSVLATDADGGYVFTGLAPGTYEISIPLTGVLAGAVNSAGGTVASGVITQTITVESDEDVDSIDFGVYFPADIGDLVFDDLNGDGDHDLGEPGFDSITVTLTGTTYPGGVATAITPVVTSTNNGAYSFDDLAPGDYVVTLTSSDLPSGVVNTLGGTSLAVTITSGNDDLTVDFGFYQPATIGDLVWDDLDGDGTRDLPGESGGIDGVTITLYSGSSAIPANEITTDTTSGGGNYSFPNLAPGTYTVEIDTGDLDADATITTAGGSTTFTTTITSGNDDLTLDFGVANPVTIGDTIYEDLNGNGSFDAGEPAIVDATGITVTLNGGSTISSTNGTYSHGPLLPGSYTVAVDDSTLPAGYTPTSPTSVTATYESGDSVDTVDFGFVRPASVGDYIFIDSNGNGSYEASEPGLAGVTVELSGPGVAPGTTITTDGTGAYSFDNLAPGAYTVDVITVPAGYSNTVGGLSQSTTLVSNEDDDTLDFGFYLGASIGDFVFDDVNGNGTFDSGIDGPLDAVTVTLYSGSTVNAGSIITTDTTDGNGAYDFGGLTAGTYTVAVTGGLPSGAVNTLGGASYTFTVNSGDDIDTADFGYYTPATIGDFVWEDLNGDGVQNDGAAAAVGIENVTVSLYTGTTVNVANLVTTDDTDANGAYDFGGLAPGTYTIALDTTDLATGAMSTTGGFVIDTIVIESGDDIDTADFGVANPASIGDLIFADNDGNGAFSSGDANLDGVTVTLTGGNLGAGSIVDTTGTNGIYGFDNLYPGTYTVTVSSTGDLDGSEFSTTGGLAQTVIVVSGETDNTVDFGFAEPASIGDTLFHDLNNNGVQDSGEPGLENVDVTITGPSYPTGDTIQTGTGVSAGQYAFTNLLPGSYTVVVNTADTDMNPAFVSTTGGNSQAVVLAAAQNIDTADFGYAAPVTIGDFVFTDPNGDGNQSDAVALGGVTLELRDALNGLVGTTTSNATTGAYSFTGVMPGTYTVNVTGGLPSGAFSTTGGNSQSVVAVSATDIDTIDFGYAQPATIGNQVYVDADASGAFDAGDTGFAATVTITGTSTGASHSGGATFPTAADGSYSITGLNPGTYDIVVNGLPGTATQTEGSTGHTITVASGATDNSADFGFWTPATLGDEVFEDMNGDSTRDLADTGLAGVELTLTGPSFPAGTVFTTDGTGDYDFTGLAPGSYTVAVTDAPAGVVNTLGGTSQTFTVTSGADIDVADFGFFVPSTLGDYVWDDLNGDGIQNDGAAADRGISGVELTLTGGGLAAPLTDTTDANGAYDFGALAPGTYQVAITSGLPIGAVSTTGGNTISTIVITSGNDDLTIDFGVALPASLGDLVFQDIDGDGTQDLPGDTGFSGVTVTITGTSANASHTSGTTTTTGTGATAGDYGIGSLLPGTYDITITPGTGNLPADAISSTGGNTQTITLTSGQTDLTVDFGYSLPASIGDQLFIDNNADGVFNAGDTGLGLVDIVLTGPDQGPTGTTQATLANGSYDFTDLAPGTYTVTVDVTDPQFVAVFGSGASSTEISSTGGNAQTITIGSTDNIDTADFGYYALGSIGDFVFTDDNGDGNEDPGDAGIAGVTVTLSGGDLAGPITTTTGSGATAGDYLFSGLTPGDYIVTTSVAGMTGTTATTQNITVVSGGDIDTADFGFIAPATIGDLLFDDLNGDGDRDPGEPGLEGVTVTLTGTTAAGAITPIVTTTGTGVNAGDYSFDNLLPGDYTVTVTNGTGDLATATYATTTGGDSQNVTVVSGETNNTIDFGYVAPATIGDLVFDDLDGDGVLDPGEPGFENVVVQISGGNLAAPITTTTGTGANAGEYSFPNLAPGTYIVDVLSGLPTGAVQTLGSGGITLTVESGDDIDTVDFGAYQPISIGDLVFIDENGNSTFNGVSGDTVLSGVEVTLSGGNLATDLIDTTDGSGIYGFDSLAPGTYTLTLTDGVPAGHVSTTGGNTTTFTLASGGDRFDLDFGLAEPVTIGDLVWHDSDGSGTFTSGEPGLGGVDLELVDGNGIVVDTTTSAGNGSYSFTNVMPSPLDYTVRIVAATVPAGYTATTPESVDVAVTSGDDIDTVDVGYVSTTSIGDFVWDDLNGDGIQDLGETGITGLTVTLTGGSLAAPLTDTTGANGDYSFDNLAPGTYTVTVTPAANSATTTGGNSQTITVLSNAPVDTVDFGYAYGASIGDRIWNDLNANGTDDGEPGLGGVEVLLTGNGVSLSDTTDGNGAYSFTGLAPGEYTITVNNTTIPVGANSGTQLTPTTVVSTTLTVASGDAVDTVDYGYATTATIGDFIFDDLDGDGTLDLPTENGLDGVTVELVDGSNVVVASDVTTNGAYGFSGVAPGTYTVRVVTSTLPAGGYAQTTPLAVGTVTVDSDDAIDTVDLGFTRPSTIGDFVWHDLDADGIFDAGEPALGGVTVNVYDSGLNLVGSDTTDSNGAYLITGIAPGTYTVQVDASTLPAGTNSGTPFVASATVPASISRTVVSGDSVTDADFAFHTTATIGDQIWHDTDADGNDDDGAHTDPWLDAITVNLVDPSDSSIVQTTTTTDGVYSFTGVAPGTYEVQVDESTVPVGYSSTTGNNPTTVTVESDELVDTIDFGYAALTGGAIGNEIFDDLDGNGVRDGGEPGIELTVELWSGGALVDTRTSTGGGYNFTNLAPGTYEVRVVEATVPGNYVSSTTAGANVSNNGHTQTFTILSGDAPITTADFGYVAPATVGDYVWHDLNADGTQNDGPAANVGLGGITVELRIGATVVDSDVTAADGSYSLSAAPGTYDVVLLASSIPTGTNSGTQMTATTLATIPVTLVSNDVITTADFGLATTASIGDTIFDDLNGDGIQQVGEPGLVGVTVELFDGTTTITVITGPNGIYDFGGLAPGDYSVSVDATTLPTGAYATTTVAPVDVTVVSDDDIDDVDLGFTVPGTITGEIFVDSNGDGTQTGETNIATEIDVDLLDDNGDVVATVTTVGGVYTFPNVIPGDYTIRPAIPGGSILTVPNAGSDDAVDSDVDPTTGESGVVTMTSGATITDVDAGVYELATIGDTVFVDLDGDGVQDANEPGLGGVAVTVRDTDGNVIGTDTTGTDGTYSIDVLPGTHSVSIDMPAGYTAGSTGTTQSVTIASGDTDDTIDFPVEGANDLNGSVIYDIENDGNIDANDPGLGDVTVTATWDGPDGPVVYTTTTRSDGSYSFEGLPPGDYTVVVDPSTLPNGIVDPTVDPDSTIDLETVVVVGGPTSSNDVDFGVSGTASLGDNVFLDANDNGVLDEGESGVAGVTVIATVTTAAGVMTYTTTTDVDGNYEFTDLPAGEYTVTIDLTTIPAGMVSTIPSLSTVLVINGADDSLDMPLVMVAGPVAEDDFATTPAGTPVVISVLDNDTVQPGTTVTVTDMTQPENGTVVINDDGTVTYFPDPGFDGTDTFEYTICDLEGLENAGDTPANRAIFCSTATVRVVTPPPPADEVVSTPETNTPPTPATPIVPGTPVADTPTTDSPTTATPEIPRTGAEHGSIQAMGFGLLLAGLALWVVSRRRRNDSVTRSNAWPAPTL